MTPMAHGYIMMEKPVPHTACGMLGYAPVNRHGGFSVLPT
jgi:hypothetical protein